jgi:hypothetical protein
MEKVQAVLLPLYFRQQNTTRFPNLHHAGVDVNLVANLVELVDAHIVGRQTRDEVDPVEGPGLTILATESSLKCIVLSTVVSIFMNAARHLDMWFIAPMSRTHVLVSPSFSSSRWANTFSSWISTSAVDP